MRITFSFSQSVTDGYKKKYIILIISFALRYRPSISCQSTKYTIITLNIQPFNSPLLNIIHQSKFTASPSNWNIRFIYYVEEQSLF